VLTGPDDLRVRFAQHTTAKLVAGLAVLRPRPGEVVGYATRVALRELGRRAEFLDDQLGRLDELIVPLVAARAPGLLRLHGIGPDTAALLLIAAGDHPERLRSEAAWAHLCGVAPIPASSGKTTRHRLNPGGDRQANHALWRIVITRMSSHPATRAYVERRSKEGLSKVEIIRCLKRYVARQVYPPCVPRSESPFFRGGLARYSAAAPDCWPSNDSPAAPEPPPAGRGLIRACPPPASGPSLSCPYPSHCRSYAIQKARQRNITRPLDKHRSIVMRVVRLGVTLLIVDPE
jgi:hypothetical protein